MHGRYYSAIRTDQPTVLFLTSVIIVPLLTSKSVVITAHLEDTDCDQIWSLHLVRRHFSTGLNSSNSLASRPVWEKWQKRPSNLYFVNIFTLTHIFQSKILIHISTSCSKAWPCIRCMSRVALTPRTVITLALVLVAVCLCLCFCLCLCLCALTPPTVITLVLFLALVLTPRTVITPGTAHVTKQG